MSMPTTKMWHACWLLFAATLLLVGAQGPGPGPGRKRSTTEASYSNQMQSRAVDTRITLEVLEEQPKGTSVGRIPIKPEFTYRFNEAPKEFTLDAETGEIRTNVVLDRESLKTDRFDLVVLSSQPTYPIEVRIIVVDINDNAPEFPEPIIAVSFSESAASGTRLLLDAATDRDIGANVVSDDYRIIAGNKDNKFKLVVTANPTGETSYLHLETTGKLDRETQGLYVLNISAKDGGRPVRHGYLQVNVTILDVNDNPPIFDHSDYIVSLNESVPPGTNVLQVMATDNDFGDNAKITYYLSETERQFTVDPETGSITTMEYLDCPQQQSCSQKSNSKNCPKSCIFTVFARDHGMPRQDGRTYVTVNLVDANDHDPEIKFNYFQPSAEFATVDENTNNGSVVAAVTVEDMDEGPNGETKVRIIAGNELNHFRLDYSASFDIVRVNGVLDREEISKYNLTVVATDMGTPARTATAFLIIHVNDVNDHEPVFEKSEYSAVLSELSPPGTYAAGITATDEDSGVNSQIYYAFVSGNDNDWFDINSESGLITTKNALDREVQGSVELNISARDGGPNPKWAHTQLKVTILDENDEAPKFSQNNINVSLSENTPSKTLVAMLTAADHDQGTNGSVTYSLHPLVQQKYPDTFVLDSLTGQLTTKTKLDREKISSYDIIVIAKDQGVPAQSSTATVHLEVLDVNDNNPEFYPQRYFVVIQDNVASGTIVTKVTASDADEGENAMVTYRLENGGDGLFVVDEWTGTVTIKGMLRNPQKQFYRLKVSAKDHGDHAANEEATVEIMRASQVEELHFDSFSGYEFQILEDHSQRPSKTGREVGKVSVRGVDSVNYYITYGDPKHNFKIDEYTGRITTANKIDREQQIMYTLTVVARTGSYYGKTTVAVTVLDLNDQKPIFLRDKEDVKLFENAAVGQDVYLARARDLDAGINSRITYNLSYNPMEQFKINEATGVIYLNKPIAAEPGTILHVDVVATDGGDPRLSSKHTVNIIIEDVNDHTPIFDHTSYETSLLESTSVNKRFFALSATDQDHGLNGHITYSISEGNLEGKFGIFPDGLIYVRSSLDREDKDYYSLSVTASDLGTPTRSSVVPVVIHVIDENDNSPQFTNMTFTFNIMENEPPDSFVGKLTATDSDIGRNAELIYSLVDQQQSDFIVDPKNGFVRTKHAFDREDLVASTGKNYITFEAIVSDNGSPRLKDKVKVNVHITDVNDNAPKFQRTPYKVAISEGAQKGTAVMKLYTNDVDEGLNGDVFYEIKSGNTQGMFEIEDATGQIFLAGHLDREKTDKYTLTVVAHDAGMTKQLSSETTVLIEVQDENDHAPEFETLSRSIFVDETTQINSELIRFKAHDADLGINSEISYSITMGNRKDTFHIDSNTGLLYLHKPLDYEDLNVYHLNITASDNGSPRLSTTITQTINVLDANDNSPSFPNTAIVRQIREGIRVHTPIVTVTAEDPDSGINGKVTYAISKQEPQTDQRHFAINPKTGVIHTLLSIDREQIDTFRLTVIATDEAVPVSKRLSAEKLVTVIVEDVNDNAPVFVSMNAAVLPKSTSFDHHYTESNLIMNIFARDLDSSTNGLVTYELTSGNSDLFRLHRSSGALTLKRPLINPEARYKLSVRATDEAVQSERKSTDAYVTIITEGGKNQNGPVFASEGFSGDVYENEPIGTSILTVRAVYDFGAMHNNNNNSAAIEYYVTNVTSNGAQVDRLFDIDTRLGVLSTAVELDRELGLDYYQVEVYAILVGTHGPPKTSKTKVQIHVLDKNDSPPSFAASTLAFSVSEDLGQGFTVARVHAHDPDTIGRLEYTLVSANVSEFALDAHTGVLRLADTLDREACDSYALTVRASDGIQHTDATITIQVTDTNDNPPAFLESAYSFDIPEDAPRGYRVGVVRAEDADIGSNSQLTYTVISDWANDVFSLNPQTGVFTLTARLDYEEVQHYILVVQAQDAGQPALSSTLTVYCNVLDLNDNAPIFDPISYSNEIFENVSIATSVLSVSATDFDSGLNGKIQYAITSGDDFADFRISDNGTVYTNKALDRETRSVYNLMITATDSAQHPEKRLASSVQATIVVKDVNDMSPEFITGNETQVAENVPLNTVVMAIKAIDKDEGRNGYIEYYLINDGDGQSGAFSLGPVDGLLRVAGKIDRERQSRYALRVEAKDRGDPPRITTTELIVNILDENDNSPVFDPKQYSASIAENASIGASVLIVSATDMDDGLNSRVRFSIVSGDKNRDFSVAEDTGIIRVAKNLNYERKSRYMLTVKAEDCGGDVIDGGIVRSDLAQVSIVVSDINDNPPTFLDSPYLAYVTENVLPPNGGYVITVQAFDADTPPFNNLVRYFIKEGDTDIFRINASTGELSLLRALDREMQGEYSLSLVAMDTGSPPLTGTGTVKIIVQDVNDNTPEFKRQSYRATIRENSPIGSLVLSPTATDRDIGLNAKLRYSLLGDKVDRFKINSETGQITTSQKLDREEEDLYQFTLMAQDGSTTEPRAVAVNLTIVVEDENDNAPTFTSSNYHVYIPDTTGAGHFVFGAKAVDQDMGDNSKITYKLLGDNANLFEINQKTGVIEATTLLSKTGKDHFVVEIEAMDNGAVRKSARTMLRIHLKSAKLFPTFASLLDNQFILMENVEEGRTITKLRATSNKKGSAAIIRYDIAGGNIGDALQIDKVSGEVQVAATGLDYETTSTYEVWFEAKDSDDPPLRSVIMLTINVTDANDNAPVMSRPLYNATVLEEETAPLLVVKVSATDVDSGKNGEIRYRLIDTFDDTFEIDEDSGEIYTSAKLDREETPTYELLVEAIDQGTPQLSGSATVLINVLDKNDNPPRFTRLFSVNVTENADIGSFVIKVTSSDPDAGENANATYSLTENPAEKFKIDPASGNVTVVGMLDREQQDEYILKIAAVDSAWRQETPLTITIQDQNDNAPEFEHSYYSFNFPELQRNIVFVGQVSATDRDKQGPNSIISYSLQQPSDLFSVDPASGEIFSKKSLKYKHAQFEPSPENVYSLTILATDNGKPPMSSECLVTINVVDANNNAPKFKQESYLTSVPQDVVPDQKLVQTIAVDDLDFGINAEISYSIVGGNGSNIFNIDRNTGWVSLRKSVQGVGNFYKIIVRATDKGIPPQIDEVPVMLVISGENKHSPVFTALRYQVIVPENEPLGSTILTVNAVDADDGPNGLIRFEISGGNSKSEFAVDAQSGAVTILQPLDYDTVQEYHINITARDLGFISKKATAMLTITLTDINDNTPVFNQSVYEGYVSENLPPKSFVYQVKATDIDSPKNAIIIYSISGGSGMNVLEIDAKTGVVRTKVSFDYEEVTLYTLNIKASNPDSTMSSSTVLKVHVTGVNEFYPRFVQPVFHFDVSESTDVGTSIGRIQASDQDAGEDGNVYYHFVGSSNDKGFAINPVTGVITVSRNLDRETQSRVVLTVLAKNSGGIRGNDTDEAQVIVAIQDGNDPPEFLKPLYEAQISEGASIGSKVIIVKAVDKDVRPQNNQFSYSIIAGNIDHAFKIDPQNGEIETMNHLDRESIEMYTLTIGGIDTGIPPQTGTTTVKIYITDINDNGPVFDPSQLSCKVLENEPPNTKITVLSARDPDLPPNGAPFAYRIIGGKHQDFVKLEKHTGLLVTTRTIDREIVPELDVLVEVEDSGRPKQRSQFNLKVTVMDQNDSPSSPRTAHVLVHSFRGEYPIGKIATVQPNDPDITGDYKCRIIEKGNSVGGLLSIPNGCNLYTSRVSSTMGHSLSIVGNDGIHGDVTSTITVEYINFDNATIQNSISIRVLHTTASHFLANHYKSFLDILKSTFSNSDQIVLYGLQERNQTLELLFAIREQSSSSVGYKSKTLITEKTLKKQSALNSLFQQEVKINYNPCEKSTCENEGICTESIVIRPQTNITDSPSIIFTSPQVDHEYKCHCREGYDGLNCERKQDPCQPNPCKAGGQCRRVGFGFQCVCPSNKDGKLCELERGDVCSNNPCRNGGSCRESPDGSSFFCLCRLGYRGNQCETLVDSCRPNPCLHGGLCISLKPGYKCSCTEGRYGRHCETSTFGFKDLSYMKFPTLDAATNDISFIFATTKPNSLLVYNYGLHTGGRSDFVAIELVNAEAVFSFGGARTAITSVRTKGKGNNLADGNWHKITATRNGKVISLSVATCTDQGDSCDECKPGDSSCYADDIGPSGTLNFNNNPVMIGGLPSADPILERPGQVHSDDLLGCVHSVSINGRMLNLSNPLESFGVDSTCGRKGTCKSTSDTCGEFGTCVDRWHTTSCVCGQNLLAPDCESSLQPISLSNGGYVELTISKKHRRMQLLDNLYGGSSWHNTRRTVDKRAIPLPVNNAVPTNTPPKRISLLFRTIQPNGVLFYAASNKHYTSLELRNGKIVYMSKQSNVVNMTDENEVNDGKWHNITLYSHHRELKVLLDNRKVGDVLDTAGVHDFLDPYLNYLSLGGVAPNMYHMNSGNKKHFEGCLVNFTVNNEIQPMNGSGSIFAEVIMKGKVQRGCSGLVGLGAVVAPDPLSIGITLVIVFFVVLLVAIFVSFVVFRLRKQSKEKSGVPGSPSNIHSKQNGNSTVINTNGLLNGENVLSRSLHVNESSMPYHSENGDVIRGIGGHPIVGPELLSKKFKERDILPGELQRTQRPDIIDREVLQKPQSIRDEHHPPLPPSVNHSHDHVSNDMNSELPEHYDLENASSIAPSDIDIIYHYKGYREAAGMRKYKANPLPGFHHKHSGAQGQAQHRHSPHHPSSFPPRGPPVSGSGSRPHQSTPLARLSPSSEMSAQQPRILTLHDISGKPLQSALLATTSSSGGVGKDVLHSNSERSLNSPVMSQLSGQSSASRKVSGPPQVTASNNHSGMGLTAEEIERLNGRTPRTSSLVSTLDAVSSSSEAPRGSVGNHLAHMPHMSHSPIPETHHSSSTTDESGNDSFTCSEIEYDNASLAGDKYKQNEPESRRSNSSISNKNNNMAPPSYDGFDSSYRGSMSTLVASDDELGGLYRPPTGSSTNTALGWDYLLNWGPNFESLAGVFKDIAELPDNVNGRVPSLRLTNANKPSEEYV